MPVLQRPCGGAFRPAVAAGVRGGDDRGTRAIRHQQEKPRAGAVLAGARSRRAGLGQDDTIDPAVAAMVLDTLRAMPLDAIRAAGEFGPEAVARDLSCLRVVDGGV